MDASVHVQSKNDIDRFMYLNTWIILAVSLPKLVNFVSVIGMIGISTVQEVKLGVAQLVLPDACLELRSITRHKTGGLVDNIY